MVPGAAAVLMSKVEVAPELELEVDVVTPLVVVRVARVMVLVTPCDATTTMDVPTWVTMVIGGATKWPVESPRIWGKHVAYHLLQ